MHPPPLPPYHHYIKEIPTFIAFCKVLLNDVKFKTLLLSWHFLVFRCMCYSPPTPHLFTPSFRQTKVVQVVYIWAKFYLFLISSSQGFKIQEFSE